MPFSNPVVGGLGMLIRESIHSPNFLAGSAGWTINKDGSAEFNDLTARGKIIIFGLDGGVFFYDGIPALGNFPTISICPPGVSFDPFGNPVQPDGIAMYNSFGKVIILLSTAKNAFYQYADTGAVQGSIILVVSFAAGTDPVNGQAYSQGVFGVNPTFGNTINVVGAFIFLSVSGYVDAAAIGIGNQSASEPGPFLLHESPSVNVTNRGRALHKLYGDRSDGTQLAQVRAYRDLNDGNVHNLDVFGICGDLKRILDGTATPGTLETWHDLGTLAGFTVVRGHYKLCAEDEIMFDIVITGTGANAASVNWSVTLPAAYRPINSKRVGGVWWGRSITAGDPVPSVTVSSAGVVTMNLVANINVSVQCCFRIPLDS